MAGQGWRMLVEQLSVGRCISLPSSATGAAQGSRLCIGGLRTHTPPVQHAHRQVRGHRAGSWRAWRRRTYIMDAARSVTAGAIDGGEKPSVPSAMLKYHATEFGRMIANDAMDVHGGKGICLGPKKLSGPRLPDRARWRSRSKAPKSSPAVSLSSVKGRCAVTHSCCGK